MKLPILPFVLLASPLVSAVGAVPAWGQTMQRPSVDLAITANPDDYQRDRDLGSRARGVSFGVSTGKVRFEFGWPSWHTLHRQRPATLTVDEQRRALSGELLYMREYKPASRVRLSWLVGGGVTSRVSRTTSVVTKESSGEILSTKREEFRRDHADGHPR